MTVTPTAIDTSIDVSSIKKETLLQQTWNGLKKNRLAMVGLFLIILLLFVTIFADFIAPYGVDDQDLTRAFTAPCKEFIFGTDHVGRDIFSRIVYGSRYSLMIGAVAATLSAVIGMLIGSLAGFYGGKTDNILMRFIDIMLAIPSTLLGISIVAALGNGIRNVIIAVAIGAVPAYARIVRASILSVKEQEYIEAARSIGASDFRIIIHHILPNCLAPIYSKRLGAHRYLLLLQHLKRISGAVTDRQDHLLRFQRLPCAIFLQDDAAYLTIPDHELSHTRMEKDLSSEGEDLTADIAYNRAQHICPDMRLVPVSD